MAKQETPHGDPAMFFFRYARKNLTWTYRFGRYMTLYRWEVDERWVIDTKLGRVTFLGSDSRHRFVITEHHKLVAHIILNGLLKDGNWTTQTP